MATSTPHIRCVVAALPADGFAFLWFICGCSSSLFCSGCLFIVPAPAKPGALLHSDSKAYLIGFVVVLIAIASVECNTVKGGVSGAYCTTSEYFLLDSRTFPCWCALRVIYTTLFYVCVSPVCRVG